MSENIVSFSGGKDSTAMLHMMLERGEKIRAVVFFDTGWEFDEMLEHIDRVEKNTGIKIVRLKPDKPFDYWMYAHEYRSTKYQRDYTGYGFPGPRCRWCTRMKTDKLKEFQNSPENLDCSICIGIAVGEERRLKTVPRKRYPLIEYGVTEREALLYCKKLGYDWGGLYDVFDRVSCFCCPLQRRIDFINMRKFFPHYWERIEAMAEMVDSRNTRQRYFKDKMTFEEYVKAKINGGNE